ncbi:pol protein [Cucumis melo var. makuwa]|uniref:Pol protein n=1 Tax=Cucumis melo var. makuwa TaxID=1194695 RepID=A0A5A7VBP2_CUCMM|nr:pol protein [Cucumis melo var. makuwa]
MHTAQSRQKSYADVRRKDLEFEIGDKVFLKRIGPVAYRLALPPSLSTVHDVFHVSMLRKYVPDPSHVVDYEPLEIDENLSYVEQPVEVLAREVDPLSVDSIEGHNRVSGKGFPTTGPRIEAENVVIHRGLHVSDYWDFMLMDLEVTVQYVVIIGLDVDHGVWTGKDSESSFGCTRLICASFGSTRLICASFGSTRLICASYGTTRLLCRVRAQRGADRREAGRTREGHMDASGFLIASAMYFVRIFDL